MTIFRASLLVLLVLTLVGCATTGKECLNWGGKKLVGYKSDITEEIQDTSVRRKFYETTSSKEFIGIKFYNLKSNTLQFTIIDQALYEEYSVPVIDKTINTTFKSPTAEKIGFIVLSPIALPLAVFNPQGAYNEAFGCTQQQTVNGLSDLTRKTKTGKTEWRDTERIHKFLVSGFSKDYDFSIGYKGAIDLSNAILNTDLTKTTTIKITCLDCDLLGQEEQNLFKDAKKTVEITADFREIKATLVAKEKTRKIEQDQRDKEAIIQRVIDAKENLQRRKETQGVPLNEFKAQCQALGFKVGSADYGNCVLELNEAK